MATKNKAVAKTASQEALDALSQQFPQAESFNRPQFPKLVFNSQTKLDDDDKVIMKAGALAIDTATEEKDEDGKTIFDREEIGQSLEGHIIYHRLRLQMWIEEETTFYSSPMYDSQNDIVPLFAGGDFVKAGTPKELRALYPHEIEYEKGGEKKTFTTSHLQEVPVLYVLIGEKLVELTITGRTSASQWKKYLKKTAVPQTITKIHSSKQTKGANKWNQMEFEAVRDLTPAEVEVALKYQKDLLEIFTAEKEFYANKRVEESAALPTGTTAGELPAGEEDGEDW